MTDEAVIKSKPGAPTRRKSRWLVPIIFSFPVLIFLTFLAAFMIYKKDQSSAAKTKQETSLNTNGAGAQVPRGEQTNRLPLRPSQTP
jgi:hypothetical protein